MENRPPPEAKRSVTDYFTGLADGYAAYRPGYPPEAIATALEGLARPVRVADVGCGTGICSRLLAEAGAEVIGLEPNADMLAVARRHPPPVTGRIAYRLAGAEDTGLPDDSVDLVICAQAFHWFDAPAALAEFRRILVSGGGRLALLWNRRDQSDRFMAGYEEVMRRAQDDAEAQGKRTGRSRSYDPSLGGLFTNVRQFVFANPQKLDRASLVGRARSASYFPKTGPLHEALEDRLHSLFDEHERDGFITFRQNAELTIAEAER